MQDEADRREGFDEEASEKNADHESDPEIYESKENAKDREEEVFEHPDYEQELEAIIRSDLSVDEKRDRLADYHYNDIAGVLDHLTPQERRALYHILGAEETSEVFAYLDDASSYIAELSPEIAADIVQEMDADDAVDVLEDLDEAQQAAIIQHIDDEEAKEDIRLIQSYEEDEIGSKMTTNFIAVRRGLSIKQAMRSLVEQAADNDNLSTIYVFEETEKGNETFYGAINLQDLIIARQGVDLDSLVTTSYPYVYDHETVADCIEQLKDYSEDSIPVLNSDMQILGVITSQDLVEVVDEEMGEDYAKLAGLTAEEDLNEKLPDSIKKRIPWLLILMGLGLVVSSVVGIFEPVMEHLAFLVAFQSVILDMAGNVGTQSLAVTIRVLMDENLTGKQKRQLVFKEMRVGFTNGLLIGTLAFAFIGFYLHLTQSGRSWAFCYTVSACIGVAMLLAMTFSSATATLVPLFFKKINVDPAVASGPMITTIDDMVGVISYYGLVWIFLINFLHY
ncbi:MAG: magnesium transporter [Clostridia bacterium]|nr:magnesium transporter [Clostridia bacterium]